MAFSAPKSAFNDPMSQISRYSMDIFGNSDLKPFVLSDIDTSVIDSELYTASQDDNEPDKDSTCFLNVLRDKDSKLTATWKPSRSAIPRISLSPLEPIDMSVFQDFEQVYASCQKYMQNRIITQNTNDDSSFHFLQDLYNVSTELDHDPRKRLSMSSLNSSTWELNGDQSEIDISVVPEMFFAENFRIDKPQTFAAVCFSAEYDANLDSPFDEYRKYLGNNSIMHEKLSWYLDIVEICIIRETELVSQSFFEALDSIKEFDSRIVSTLSRLENIKNELNDILVQNTKFEKRSIDLESDRLNIKNLQTAFIQIYDLVRSFENVILMNSIDEAYTAIKDLKNQIQSLDQIYPNLVITLVLKDKINKLLNKNIESAILGITDFLINDFKEATSTCNFESFAKQLVVKNCETIKTFYIKESADESKTIPKETDLYWQLSPLKSLLLDSSRMPETLAKLRLVILKEFKLLTRSILPSSELDSENSISSNLEWSMILAEKIRTMTEEQFYCIIRDAFEALLLYLSRLEFQFAFLTMDSTPEIFKLGDNTLKDLKGLLSSLLLNRISKLFIIRAGLIGSTSRYEFMSLYALQKAFCIEHEKLCGTFPKEISEFWSEKFSRYLQSLFSTKFNALMNLLDLDSWEEATVDAKYQQYVDTMMNSSNEIPKSWFQNNFRFLQDQASPPENLTQTKRVKCVPNEYYTSKSLLFAISMLEEFCQYVLVADTKELVQISNFISETARRYDSRTRQLILGAGATLTAGLKSITAKHLAVASQSIELLSLIVLALGSFLRKFFNKANNRIAIDFDKSAREMRDHLSEIDKKFVEIMADRAQNAIQVFQKSSWKSECLHKYMEDLIKDISRIEKILIRFFGPSTHGVMHDIKKSSDMILRQGYEALAPEDRKFVVVDINQFLIATKNWSSTLARENNLVSFLSEINSNQEDVNKPSDPNVLNKIEQPIASQDKLTSIKITEEAIAIENQAEPFALQDELNLQDSEAKDIEKIQATTIHDQPTSIYEQKKQESTTFKKEQPIAIQEKLTTIITTRERIAMEKQTRPVVLQDDSVMAKDQKSEAKDIEKIHEQPTSIEEFKETTFLDTEVNENVTAKQKPTRNEAIVINLPSALQDQQSEPIADLKQGTEQKLQGNDQAADMDKQKQKVLSKGQVKNKKSKKKSRRKNES